MGTLAVNNWASVEFASLVFRDVRMSALSVAQGRRQIAEFEAMVADALILLMPTANDFTLAQQYVANFSTKLRAPDALHLAVAHNNGAEFVATLDDGMLFAAKKLKVAARRVIR